MNINTLNIVSLDDGLIIKKGGGSGGVKINNQEKSIDITENGVFEVLPDIGFTGLAKVMANVEIAMPRPKYTGHADAEGLRAIGWTEEDIAYYQENGVNWNEEDDQYHLVSDDNKALYGVLTISNISTYKDRIVYLPKIDTSGKNSMSKIFYDCYVLSAIPQLDTSNVKNMRSMFSNCHSLTSIPQLNTSKVTDMSEIFNSCRALTSIPQLDTSNVTNMSSMFNYCYSLTSIPQLDTSNVTNMSSMFSYCHSLTSIPQLDTSKVTDMSYMFSSCYSLTSIPQLDTSNVKNMRSMFSNCYSLTSIPQLDTSKVYEMAYMFQICCALTSIPQLDASKVIAAENKYSTFYYCTSLTCLNLKNVKVAFTLPEVNLLSKDSLLYLINNEAATSAITITLASYAYDRWATDPDVVAALANHPNISISK